MTDTTTAPALDLDAIRRRAQAATPGPWTLRNGWGPASDGLMRFVRIANADHDSVLEMPDDTGELAATQVDAEFIAAARTDIPALLAEVDRLRAELEGRRVRLVAAEADLLNVRGVLSPQGGPAPVPMELGPEVAPAVQWLADETLRLRAALTAEMNRRDDQARQALIDYRDANHRPNGKATGYCICGDTWDHDEPCDEYQGLTDAAQAVAR